MIFNRLKADVTWSDWDERWYRPDPGSVANIAGFPIGPDTANRVSAVFACNSLIAETLAATPCLLYRRLDNGGKERATDHRLYRTVKSTPNSWMTPMDFFGFGQGHVGLRGGVVNEIRDRGDRVELVPHAPHLVTTEQMSDGRLRFRIRDPKGGPDRTLLQDEVLHVKDLTTDGILGLSRAALAKEAIAVAAAGEAFVGGFFKNDATGRLVITHPGPGVPDKEKRAEFKAELDQKYGGYRNTRKPMILYAGMKAEEVGKHDDGGFLIDPRNYQVADIARFWRIPLFMIGLEEKSTTWGTGIEQQKQGFVDFTMRPWYTRWQQAMSRDLLSEDEQEEYFFEFLLQDLLRGDLQSRSEALALQKDHGVISPNEWRIIESMNPREGGDEYQETPQGAAPNGRRLSNNRNAATVPEPLLADAARRIASAELREVTKHGARAVEDGTRFLAWAQEFYTAHRDYAAKVLAPIAEAYGLSAIVVDETTARLARTAMDALTPKGMPDGWADRRTDEVQTVIDETFRCALQPAA